MKSSLARFATVFAALYLPLSFFIFFFYGCRRDCLVVPSMTEISILQPGLFATFLLIYFFPLTLVVIIPLLIVIYKILKRKNLCFDMSLRVKIFVIALLAFLPLPGIYLKIQRSNAHPYYWDVVNKGIDQSYLSFVAGDVIYNAIYYVVFLVISILVLKMLNKKTTSSFVPQNPTQQ